ncbi:MAG: SDR family NAD(P)-dependent oxidoreductase [Planctomycetota bacterium]
MSDSTSKPLSGRTALVTGASAGIGRATARALHAAGATVVAAARRLDRLEALASECPGLEVAALDVRDAAAVEALCGDGRFDLVLANAGLARGTAQIHEGDVDDWAEVLDTNVKGVLHVVRAALPGMLERGSGDVVLLGSVAGRQVYPGGNVYCASKHAVRAIYEGLRQDAGGRGVRFSTVDPGMVETDFSRVRFRGDEQKSAQVYAGFEPLTPEDLAETILWVVTRPAHVNIGEVVLWPTAQASTTRVARS